MGETIDTVDAQSGDRIRKSQDEMPLQELVHREDYWIPATQVDTGRVCLDSKPGAVPLGAGQTKAVNG